MARQRRNKTEAAPTATTLNAAPEAPNNNTHSEPCMYAVKEMAQKIAAKMSANPETFSHWHKPTTVGMVALQVAYGIECGADHLKSLSDEELARLSSELIEGTKNLLTVGIGIAKPEAGTASVN